MQPQNTEVIIFLIAANIIVVVAAVFFFLIIRIQQKRKQLYRQQLMEKEYKTREEAFLQISRDLHDEVGSSLSGIGLFTQLAGEQLKINNINEAVINIEKANTYASQVIEKVSDMAWLLKPSQEPISMLAEKLKAYCQATAGAMKIQVHFATVPESLVKELSIQQRKAIYLISKEAINNAVKYAECKNIYYSIIFANSRVSIIIKDDGKGFSMARVVVGNGLANMKARAEEISSLLNINSIPGNGTTIELHL